MKFCATFHELKELLIINTIINKIRFNFKSSKLYVIKLSVREVVNKGNDNRNI